MEIPNSAICLFKFCSLALMTVLQMLSALCYMKIFFYFSKINISDGIQVFSFSIEKISKKYVKWFLMMCRNPVLGTRYRTGGHLTLALVPKKSLILLCLQKNIETRPFLKFLCALPGDRPVATGGHSVAVPSQIFVPPKFCCAQKNLS